MTAVVVQENLDRIDELSMIVAGCTVLLFILSEGCLESPFCRQELTAAVAADVPVLLITKEGARWPDAYGAMSDAFPSARLIDGAFAGAEEPCRSVFKSKAIQHSNEYFSAFSATVIKRVQSAVAESANAYPMGASAQALAQRNRLPRQVFVGQRCHGRLERINAHDRLAIFLEQPFIATAEDPGQKVLDHGHCAQAATGPGRTRDQSKMVARRSGGPAVIQATVWLT